MKTIELLSHDFTKVNLVSLKGGKDKYRCSVCGVEGMRPAFLDYIVVTEKAFRAAKKCTFVRIIPKKVRPSKIFIENNMPHIGLVVGEYDVIEAPEKYKQYENDVWVFSESRNEAIRLLEGEYKVLQPTI